MTRTAKNIKITTFDWAGMRADPVNAPLELTVNDDATDITSTSTITLQEGDVWYDIENQSIQPQSGVITATSGKFMEVVNGEAKVLPRQPKPGELVACITPMSVNSFLASQISVVSSDGTICSSQGLPLNVAIVALMS